MSRYKGDPRELKARFNSICPETGKEIKQGDICIYYPSNKKAYHIDSKNADNYRLMIADDYLEGN